MPKALCLISLGASVVVLALFLVDAIMAMLSMEASAPLRGANLGMDLAFVFCAGVLAYLSWSTFREQR